MITKNVQIFLLALLVSISMGWGINAFSSNLTEFVFARRLTSNPEILAAYAAQQELQDKLTLEAPYRERNVPSLEMNGKAALSLYLDKEQQRTKVLFEKNSDTPLLIASLTKLMTSLTALKNYPPSLQVPITQDILDIEGDSGHLRSGDLLTVKDLIYLSLIESSNDAAYALGAPMGQDKFMNLMNQEADTLSLQQTTFANLTGLDPDLPGELGNYSTASDITQIAIHILQNDPQIFDILSQQKLDLYDQYGQFHHTMKNTNDLLEYRDWPTKILGGKTGWTPLAKGSLLLVTESPDQNGYIINVLLGSKDRFEEMKHLLRWILQAYQW